MTLKSKWALADVADIRGFVVVCMVVMLFYILHLVATHPELATNDLFKDICKQLAGVGGFGLVLMFLFGGSKASNEAVATVNDMARKPAAAPAAPTQTDQMNVTADKVTVDGTGAKS